MKPSLACALLACAHPYPPPRGLRPTIQPEHLMQAAAPPPHEYITRHAGIIGDAQADAASVSSYICQCLLTQPPLLFYLCATENRRRPGPGAWFPHLVVHTYIIVLTYINHRKILFLSLPLNMPTSVEKTTPSCGNKSASNCLPADKMCGLRVGGHLWPCVGELVSAHRKPLTIFHLSLISDYTLFGNAVLKALASKVGATITTIDDDDTITGLHTCMAFIIQTQLSDSNIL